MNRRIATYAAAAGVVVLVAAVVILNSPADGLYSGLPPTMLLVAESGEYEAGIGSYCGQTGLFTGKCADRTLEGSLPDETVVIHRGTQFEVRMVDYKHPEILDVTLRDPDFDVMELQPTQVSQTGFVADIPKGVYILSFFAKWENASMDDASYFCRISVV